MLVSCPNCKSEFKLSRSGEEGRRFKLRCPQCKAIFVIRVKSRPPSPDSTDSESPPDPSIDQDPSREELPAGGPAPAESIDSFDSLPEDAIPMESEEIGDGADISEEVPFDFGLQEVELPSSRPDSMDPQAVQQRINRRRFVPLIVSSVLMIAFVCLFLAYYRLQEEPASMDRLEYGEIASRGRLIDFTNREGDEQAPSDSAPIGMEDMDGVGEIDVEVGPYTEEYKTAYDEGYAKFLLDTPEGHLEAKKLFEKALRLRKNDPATLGVSALNHVFYAILVRDSGLIEQTLILAKKASGGGSIDYGYLCMAAYYMARGLGERSARFIEYAMDINARNPSAYYLLARHELLGGEGGDQAESNLLEALKLEPNCTKAHLLLGFFYFDKGDYQKAADCFRRAKSVSPDKEGIDGLMETTGLAENQRDPASRFSNDLDVARAYADLGESEIAKRLLERILREQGEQAGPDLLKMAYYRLGRVHYELREFDESHQNFLDALQIDPQFDKAKSALDLFPSHLIAPTPISESR